ncbi:cell division control protein Cdc6 [Daldinia caldariorum]|uniref:cell division control protein Cdc6 n=1 Tax=Daldinia caldariorum TaxID=326644 RepID=UPI0020075145|nr:cell division control protein Cdc6 [Daldinia caldariorum]KAI1465803.1 cell division control protein Cdc6 [Daldinia caldariorum]
MARSSLGKRTRSTKETEVVDVPAKRTRHQTRTSSSNDENVDPEDVTTTTTTEDNLDDQISILKVTDNTPSRRIRRIKKEEEEECAPPTPRTPSTPRFRDALSKVPVTPRHRVMSAGRVSKRLFPQTPLTPTALQTVYHHARQLFSRSADPGQLIGRDEERSQLKEFLQRCSKPNPNGCIYVSGPPGTGKSAMINEVTQELVEKKTVKKAYINCMSIKSSKDLYGTLIDQICDETDISEGDAAATIEKLFIPRKKTNDVYLIVLDEIDHILTLDLESLYRIFEWSMQKSSRLVLIGIANALDLTDRFLPRLKSRNLKPELLPFLPYSAAQIKSIITTRLKSLVPEGSPLPFIHPAAIELCSRKVSSQTGDLRKAFEICRRALDLVEAETKQKHEAEIKEKLLLATPSKKPLGENTNLSSSPKRSSEKAPSAMLAESLRRLTIETAPRVTIAHLNKVTAAAFSNGTNQRLKTLNLQQKAALCSLMALEKRNRASRTSSVPTTPSKSQTIAPSIKRLYETYNILCTRESVLHPLSSSEFREVIGSLETLSLVSAVDGKTGSLAMLQTPSKRGKKGGFASGIGLADEKKVASCVGEKELEQAVEGLGVDILKSILSGEALD